MVRRSPESDQIANDGTNPAGTNPDGPNPDRINPDVLHPDVLDRARAREPERYLSALLAPASARADLLAIAAFSADLIHITATVSDPMIGEIRLQWWRDQFEPLARGETIGNPIADALGTAIRAHRLPLPLLTAMTEAHAFDLYPDPLPDNAALTGYLTKTEAIPFELSLRILGVDGARALAIATPAAIAFGCARLAYSLPASLAQGRAVLPETDFAAASTTSGDILSTPNLSPAVAVRLIESLTSQCQQAGAAVWPQMALLSRQQRSALLPLAALPSVLRAAKKQAAAGFRVRHEVQPLSRIVRITVAHVLGRFGH